MEWTSCTFAQMYGPAVVSKPLVGLKTLPFVALLVDTNDVLIAIVL
jgi:hypothetical protein